MIAIDRGDCLRELGAIDWAAVREWLGPCPDGKRMRGAPSSSPGKKRLLAEAVEILKRRGGFSLNDACSIVADVVRFTRHVPNPARTIEEAWREYACGKPTGDGKRSYRYGMLRLEGEPSLWAAVRRIRRPRTRARCQCAAASEAVAPPPARLFAHTAYGVSVWAWFVLECYAYHRPLRAVARALATLGIPIAPGTLADAQSRLLRVFEPLDEAQGGRAVRDGQARAAR